MSLRRRQPQNQPRARVAAPQGRSEVFSYHANRSIREGVANTTRTAPEPTPKRKPRVNWAKRLPVIIALVVIVICCINILTLNSNAKVIPVTPTNEKDTSQLFLQNTTIYQNAVDKLFASSVVNKNKLTVDTARITADLRNQFPELQNVSIALPLIGHRPIVYLQPASPVLFLTTQGGGLFILDKSGRAVVGGNDAVAQGNKLHIPTVRDASGVAVHVGQIALPSSNINFIAQVVGQLQAKSMVITGLSLPAGASELDVNIQGIPYGGRFNMQGDAREQAGAFLAVRQYLVNQHIAPGQYVDVRVPERAYYK